MRQLESNVDDQPPLTARLLAPFRWLRDARRILRLKEAQPGGGALFRCWAGLKWARQFGQVKPFCARLGPLELHTHTWAECYYLFEEVFLNQEYLVDLASPDPFIIDCGANVGFATLYFKLRHPAARVMCFEPNPSCFRFLQQNVTVNRLVDVTLIEAACGRENATVKLFTDPEFSPMSSVRSRRLAGQPTCEVKQVRLSDHLGGPVDLLKLDVEGAEWDVLDDLIASSKLGGVERLLIEYHHRLDSPKAELGRFLGQLETAGLTYSLHAFVSPKRRFSAAFQDVMIYACKPELAEK